jgi:hypothetical protein
MNLTNIFETTRSEYTSVGTGRYTTLYAGIVDNALSYDGITFYPSTGTVTGTISIYGVNQ